MSEAPQDRTEIMAEYESLLPAHMVTCKEYTEAVRQCERQGEDIGEDEAVQRLEVQMMTELQTRINLLRQAGIPNIEDIFPQVKRSPEAQQAYIELRQVIKQAVADMVNGGTCQPETVHEKVIALTRLSEVPPLNSAEEQQFREALIRLAHDHGYKIQLSAIESKNCISLRKGSLSFEIQHFQTTGEHGIAQGRISLMFVHDENGNDHMRYDRDWEMVNQNPDTQREIDKVIALFN